MPHDMTSTELTSQLEFTKEINEILVGLLHKAESLCGLFLVAATPAEGGLIVQSQYLVGAILPEAQATFAEAVGEVTGQTLARFAEETCDD